MLSIYRDVNYIADMFDSDSSCVNNASNQSNIVTYLTDSNNLPPKFLSCANTRRLRCWSQREVYCSERFDAIFISN